MDSLYFLFFKLWTLVKQLFGPPRASPALVADVNTGQAYTGDKEEQYLRGYYNDAEDPCVSFRVFYLRVAVFKWTMEEALYEEKHGTRIFLYDKHYEISEIYRSCKRPAVTYNAFYNRVILRNWPVLEALNTPNKQ